MRGRLIALAVCFLAAHSQPAVGKTFGSPPSHPAIPRLESTTATSRPLPWARFAGAGGSEVLLDSPKVEEELMTGTAWIRSPAESRQFRLSDGSLLTLDSSAVVGEYVLANGKRLWVRSGGGYPLRYEFESYRVRVLRFRVQGQARVGFLCTSPSESVSAACYVRVLGDPHQTHTLGALDSRLAFECPGDGPQECAVRIDPARRTPLVVTWYAYPETLGGETQPSGARWNAGRFEWKAGRARLPEAYPIGLTIPSTELAESLQVIGAVEITPETWTAGAMVSRGPR